MCMCFHLRDIQFRYKMKLSDEARAEIRRATATNDTSQLHTVFARAQLDALQHIRNYWVPRFVLHQEFAAAQRCRRSAGILVYTTV